MVDCFSDAGGGILPLIVYAALTVALYPYLNRFAADAWKFSTETRAIVSYLVWLPILAISTMPFIVLYIWCSDEAFYVIALSLLTMATIILLICVIPVFIIYNVPTARNWSLLRDIRRDDTDVLNISQPEPENNSFTQ